MAGTTNPAAEKQVVAERMTVGLIPKAVSDLADLMTLTGLTKTDVINRAVSLYAFVAQQLANGNDLLIRNNETGELERIRLL